MPINADIHLAPDQARSLLPVGDDFSALTEAACELSHEAGQGKPMWPIGRNANDGVLFDN